MAGPYELRRQARGGDPPGRRPPWRRRLIWIGVVLAGAGLLSLGGFFLWCWCHVKTIYADVRGNVVELASHVDARLATRNVRSGQVVAAGEEVARLDDSQLRAVLAASEAQRDITHGLVTKAKANLTLVAGRVEADIALAAARIEVARAQVKSAERGVEEARGRVAEEIRRAEAVHEQARAVLGRLEKGTREEDIESARARLAAARAMAKLYSLEVKQSQELVAEGIDSQHLLEVKKAQLDTQQNRVREAEIAVAKLIKGPTREEMEAARQATAARAAELALARAGARELDSLSAQLDVRREDVKRARAELACAEALRAEIAIAREQVKAAEAALVKAEADVTTHRVVLASMSVVTPIAGTVISTSVKVGEICRKGVPFILVADRSGGCWVEGYIRERDAVDVRPGQSARVEIVTGSGNYVKGKVAAVGLTTYSATPRSPSKFSANPAHLTSEFVWVKIELLEQRPEWRLGMSAKASIRVH